MASVTKLGFSFHFS